jgi:signal-transduction protein with cAMP-binding, CBS, and nucleotidyltransferase domain
MDRIRDILDDKGYEVHFIAPTATALEAVDRMCNHRVGALLVATADATLGIISERDVLTRVILERREPAETRVEQVMTRAVACVHLDTEAREAMAVMTERRCRHLPVVADGGVVGMVSIGDLVRWASREQEIEINMLTEYVRGGYR